MPHHPIPFRVAAAAMLLLAACAFGTRAPAAADVAFPADSGVLDIRAFGAVGDGVTDDTAAIQRALDFERNGNNIVYVPDGTWLISDRLEWPGESNSSTGDKRTILQGQSRDGAVIRLADSAVGYQDPGSRRALVNTGRAPAQRFRNAIRDLTLDTGSGNAGAVGLEFIASNQGGIRGVTIRSGDGQGVRGLDMGYTDEIGPLLVRDLRVEGFDTGIYTAFEPASVTFENVELADQNVVGWNNFAQTAFIRNLSSTNAVPALVNERDGPGRITLIGADLSGTGTASSAAAIVNGNNFFGRDLAQDGYERLLQNRASSSATSPRNPDVTVGSVEEYLSHGEPVSLFPSPDRSLNLEVKETPRLAFDDLSRWTSPLDFGGAVNSGRDESAAIQAAIDSAGTSTVYLPNGTWRIDNDVVLRGGVERLIGTEAKLIGSGSIVLAEDAAAPDTVVVERIQSEVTITQDSTRTLVLSSIDGGAYRNTTSGTGDLFIEDVAFDDPLVFRNQNVWARQLDQETDTQLTGDEAKIVNDGSKLWILGLKTEKAGTVIKTTNGGLTELLGAYVYATGDEKIDPMFVVEDAGLSVSGLFQTNFNGNDYQTWAVETRDGETRTLEGDFGRSGTFYAYAVPEPGAAAVAALVGGLLLSRRRSPDTRTRHR